MPSFCLCPATLLPSPVTTVLALSLCSCRDILYVYKQICVCVLSFPLVLHKWYYIHTGYTLSSTLLFKTTNRSWRFSHIYTERAFFCLFFENCIFHCLYCSILDQSPSGRHRGFPGFLLLYHTARVIITGSQQCWRCVLH